MEIETDFALKLFFPNPKFVQTYYEAVANSVDAEADEIDIEIIIEGNIHNPRKLEITIRDNGIGFTEERYEQFKRLTEPRDPDHKGLGRLIFLRYFSRVDIESVFDHTKRTFSFVDNFDGKCQIEPATSDESGTELVFQSFRGDRVKSYDDLRPKVLKQSLLEQFLPVLYQRKRDGRAVEISIRLITDEDNPQKEFFSDSAVLDKDSLPSLRTSTIQDPRLDLFGSVEVSYAIRRDQGASPLLLTAAVVDGRTIPLNLVPPKAVPADISVLFLFDSDLFTGRSDSARQRLVLPDDLSDDSLSRILKQEVGRILSEELPEIQTRNEQTRTSFEERLPHLIGLFDEDTVGLIDRTEAIENAQRRFFRQQQAVLEADPSDDAAFEKSLEMSARSLTEYILYRDWVVKRLTMTTPTELEATIHNLIVPQYSRLEQTTLVSDVYRNNAWILDDKFMTFRTILSESTMSEVIEAITLQEDLSGDEGRPDISMIFSADPKVETRVDVVVVELKRRKIDDKEASYAGTQLVKRARKLVDYCPNIQRVWYYGIVEIDSDQAQLLIDMKWIPLYSKDMVFYQEFNVGQVPAPTFLLSFDAITKDAAARNHTFLEILKSNFRQRGSLAHKASSE